MHTGLPEAGSWKRLVLSPSLGQCVLYGLTVIRGGVKRLTPSPNWGCPFPRLISYSRGAIDRFYFLLAGSITRLTNSTSFLGRLAVFVLSGAGVCDPPSGTEERLGPLWGLSPLASWWGQAGVATDPLTPAVGRLLRGVRFWGLRGPSCPSLFSGFGWGPMENQVTIPDVPCSINACSSLHVLLHMDGAAGTEVGSDPIGQPAGSSPPEPSLFGRWGATPYPRSCTGR